MQLGVHIMDLLIAGSHEGLFSHGWVPEGEMGMKINLCSSR